jgi:hypothetical protein
MVIDENIDVLALTELLTRKNKKFQAIALGQIETLLIDQPELYEQVRKIVLDSLNDLTRLVLSVLFEDVEKPDYRRG